MSAIQISREPIDSPGRIEPLWRDLEARADASFFQSWTWIGSWLATTRHRPACELLVARQGGGVIGAAVLARGSARRHRLIPLRSLYLNRSGDPAEDVIFIEFNGFLVDRAHATATEDAMIAALLGDQNWDDLVLSGVPTAYEKLVSDRGLQAHVTGKKSSPFADLRPCGGELAHFIQSRSRNTRDQVKRSFRLYAARGQVTVESAKDATEAIGFLHALKPLHQAHWNARQEPGAFALPYFERFHEALIQTGLPLGEIALLRVRVGDQVIGYLYNFVYRGRMLAYQSGFAYADDNRLKPGLVCHMSAIERAMAAGCTVYDFLAGDARYKTSLATGSNQLLWIAAERPRLVFRVENTLRRLKQAWVAPRNA